MGDMLVLYLREEEVRLQVMSSRKLVSKLFGAPNVAQLCGVLGHGV